MLQAQNGRQFNLAAKTIRAFLLELTIELSHSEALTLVSRLTGHANYEAAKASLEGTARGVAPEVSTWRQLAHAIGTLDEEQLNMPVQVTEGCDENGNATFTRVVRLLLANDTAVHAGTGIFQENQPLLLVEEFEATDEPNFVDTESVKRVCMQFECATGEPGQLALDEIQKIGLSEAIPQLNEIYGLNICLGPYVAFSESCKGYWNTDFGFVGDKASATGYETLPSLSISPDLELVPYAEAQDLGPDDEFSEPEKVRGTPVSRYQWPNRYQEIWKELSSRVAEAYSAVQLVFEAQGYCTEVIERKVEMGKQLALELSTPAGKSVGNLVVVLYDDWLFRNAIAASVGLYFEEVGSGSQFSLDAVHGKAFSYATEVSCFLEDSSWLNREFLAESIAAYLKDSQG